MTHPRTTIREAFKTTLVAAAITGITSKVYKSRRSPIHAEESGVLPALLIYSAGEETAVVGEERTDKLNRTYPVAVEIVAKDITSDGLEDDLDAIADEVEEAMKDLDAFLTALPGSFMDLVYTGCSPKMGVKTDGEEYVAALVQTFNVRYWY